MAIQINNNNTFNTFEFLNHPTPFYKDNFNITLNKAIEIASSAAK